LEAENIAMQFAWGPLELVFPPILRSSSCSRKKSKRKSLKDKKKKKKDKGGKDKKDKKGKTRALFSNVHHFGYVPQSRNSVCHPQNSHSFFRVIYHVLYKGVCFGWCPRVGPSGVSTQLAALSM
jgi:hypothetical protein